MAFGATGVVYPQALFGSTTIVLLIQSPMHHVVLCAVGVYFFITKQVDTNLKT
jgi:hypothetical protein